MSVSIRLGTIVDPFWAYHAQMLINLSEETSDQLKVTSKMFSDWLKPTVRDVIFTLTGSESEKEFRVWTKFPSRFAKDHVEVFGNGGLISVTGQSDEVEKYLKEFLKIYPLTPATYPNGVVVYLPMVD